MNDETKATMGGGFKYLCLGSDCRAPKMSVSYVELTMCAVMLAGLGPGHGTAHAVKGGVGLMEQKGVAPLAPGLCMS